MKLFVLLDSSGAVKSIVISHPIFKDDDCSIDKYATLYSDVSRYLGTGSLCYFVVSRIPRLLSHTALDFSAGWYKAVRSLGEICTLARQQRSNFKTNQILA